MKEIIKFILVGYFFAILIEFQFNILATSNIGNFIFTLFFYIVFLTISYFINKFWFSSIKNKVISSTAYYFFFGIIGLMFEWFVIGNSPWGNPDAIQIGQWSFWIAITFIPKIYIETEGKFKKLKDGIRHYIIAYAIITTVVGFALPFHLRLFWLVSLQVVGYSLLHIFYVKYLVIINKSDL